MKKFSTRSQYGIRLMVPLARHYGGGPIPLSELARDAGLPLPYLEQIAAQLRRAALLRSRPGVRGGYTLGRSPDSITIADIVRCLEGSLAPVRCLAAGSGAGRCGHAATPCAAHAFWERLQESILATLEGTSVADLVGEASR
mgnify:CR=1 FL=1